MSPAPGAKPGIYPSPDCRSGAHFQCAGSFRKGLFGTRTLTCTCSCHQPPPSTPPRGKSGVSR